MSRTPIAIHLDFIAVDRSSGAPIARQICDALIRAVTGGTLPVGTRLPSSRQLAEQLGVSRKSVLTAYDRLIASRYARGQSGSGTYVSYRPPAVAARGSSAVALSKWATTGDRAIRSGDPRTADPSRARWMRRIAAATRHLERQPTCTGTLTEFRDAIAEHLPPILGVSFTPAEVIAIPASELAIAALARIAANPGELAVTDRECEARRRALEAFGIRCFAADAADEEGIDVTHGPADARVFWLSPSAEGAVGTTMSAGRRYATAAWANRKRILILEDDFEALLDPGDDDPAPLKAIDRRGVTIFVGAVWRTFAPAAEVGFAIAPPDLAEAYRRLLGLLGGAAPLPQQAAFARFVRSGDFSKHLNRLIAENRRRREALACRARELPENPHSIGRGTGG